MTYEIVSERRMKYAVKVAQPNDAYAVVKRYTRSKQEQFLLLTLTGAHEVISVSIISIGLVNRTLVHPREIFAKAIRDRAVAIIICHNHPSGVTEPSDEDLTVTKRLAEAGELLGIPVLDHLIISKSGFSSLKQLGHIC